MAHVVKAGYVTVTTAVGVGRAAVDIPRGATVPGDVPAEELDQLLALGHIEPSEPVAEAPPAPRPRKRATKAR